VSNEHQTDPQQERFSPACKLVSHKSSPGPPSRKPRNHIVLPPAVLRVVLAQLVSRRSTLPPPSARKWTTGPAARPLPALSSNLVASPILGGSLNAANSVPRAVTTGGNAIANCGNTWCNATSSVFVGCTVTSAPTIAIAASNNARHPCGAPERPPTHSVRPCVVPPG